MNWSEPVWWRSESRRIEFRECRNINEDG